jgi:hypothetical protein
MVFGMNMFFLLSEQGFLPDTNEGNIKSTYNYVKNTYPSSRRVATMKDFVSLRQSSRMLIPLFSKAYQTER